METVRSPLIRLEEVGRTYQMGEVEVNVLRDVTLDIAAGEILAVVGPSGSGKSTLLNLIGGLDRPSRGRIFYRDEEMTAPGYDLTQLRREHIGFVFQFYNLVPTLTARENVLVAAEISRNPRDVDDMLDLVGLAQRKDHFPAQLSGGEQQRVSIARAIAKSPDLLLCDEPTGALDATTGRMVLELLVDLNRTLETTVLIITHNAALAAVAHRRISLSSGAIVEILEHAQPLPPAEVSW